MSLSKGSSVLRVYTQDEVDQIKINHGRITFKWGFESGTAAGRHALYAHEGEWVECGGCRCLFRCPECGEATVPQKGGNPEYGANPVRQ